MVTMARTPERGARGRKARTLPVQAPPQIGRGWELGLTILGMVATIATLGSYTAVVNQMDEATFTSSVRPILFPQAGADLTDAAAYEIGRTLAAWFGFTLVAVLVLAAIGIFKMRRRPWRRSTGWWLAAAGLVCLVGSQLIFYPVAFPFFLAAGLFAARSIPDRSTQQ